MGRIAEILKSVRQAKLIAADCFGAEHVGHVRAETDPECGDRYLVLHASIGPGVEEALLKYNKYTSRLVSETRRDTLYLLCLSFDVYD